MKEEVKSLWERSLQAHETASELVANDPDASASRAYYAAFYAVSALFLDEGRDFSKHSAVEAAVHRDIVKEKRMTDDFGADYSFLRGLRDTGDYGGWAHVSADDAKESVAAAGRIIEKVAEAKKWKK